MPHTLLLADDSVTIQRVIELTFADEDIKVVAVGDGDQAIERLNGAAPDIVLADIAMPGKNGYEVAQYIRQTPKLSHIPVVLLTGAFEPVDQARAAQAGCDGVLAKPFEPQLVIGRVKDLLAKGRTVADAADAHGPSSPAPVASPADPAHAAASTPQLDEYFDRLDVAFSNPGAPAAASWAARAPTEPVAVPPPASPAPADIDWFSAAPAEPEESWDVPAPAAENAPTDLPVTFASPEPPVSDRAHADAHSLVLVSDVPTMAPVAPPFPAAEFEPAPTDVERPITEPVAPIAAPPPANAFTAPPSLNASPAPVSADAPAAPPLTAVPASDMPSLGDAFAALLAAEGDTGDFAAHWPGVTQPPAAPAITDAVIEDVVARVLARLSDAVVRTTTADIVSQVAERMVREEIERIKASIK